jgi:hypothetical protein
MRTHLSFDDLSELTDFQKNTLRSLWKPALNDLAAMIIWTDVENDEYELALSLVRDARVMRRGHDCDVQLKLVPLDQGPGAEMGQGNEAGEAGGDVDDEEADGPDFSGEDHYLSMEFCLPLFSIGQMIGIIKENNPMDRFLIDLEEGEAIVTVGGRDFLGEELCDALWEAVKSLL